MGAKRLVLILIVLEDGLGDEMKKGQFCTTFLYVLILIVLEDGLGALKQNFQQSFRLKSLNPYCLGGWSRRGSRWP